MRIVQIVPHYIPAYRYGGPLQVAHSLGVAFVQGTHEVVVVTTNQADEKQTLDVPIDEPIYVDGVLVYYEPVLGLHYWGFSPKLWKRSEQEIAQADIVLVHAHYQFANWVGAWLARRAKIPYVIFAHGSLHINSITNKRTYLKKLYLRLFEHRNMSNALFIAFNANEEREQSLYVGRGEVVPSGVNENDFGGFPALGLFLRHYPELKGKTNFLFLGRLDIQQKGLDMLIPAFAQLVTMQSDAHLVLAGPDEDGAASQLRLMVQKYGITDRVTFTGLISGDLKKAALQEVDVFVLPSRFEGLSIALLEALYMGLPVLVTDRVGLHCTIQELQAGIVARPDIQSILQALTTLSDPERRMAMQGRAISLVREQYNWKAIANNLLYMIEASHAVGIG